MIHTVYILLRSRSHETLNYRDIIIFSVIPHVDSTTQARAYWTK